jgi:hypothetical protein
MYFKMISSGEDVIDEFLLFEIILAGNVGVGEEPPKRRTEKEEVLHLLSGAGSYSMMRF